jgi:hypothetical protein
VDTYIDPDTGKSYDFGVMSYFEYGNSKEFFARFNVTVSNPKRRPVQTRYVDFTNGQELTDNYIGPATGEVNAALQKYLEICEKYEHMLAPGYWNFPPGDQIPADLLLPIDEFVAKHSIVAALPRIFAVVGGGIGARQNFTNALTLYIMQVFGAPITRAILGGRASFTPVSNNMELYDKIASILGKDVMLESTVVESERSEDGVKLVVQGKNGRKLILAKRLLLSIQPTLENMEPFDLSSRERSLFSKAKYGRSYMSIAKHSVLPNETALVNLPEAATPSNYFAFIQPPFVSRFEHYGSPTKFYRVPIGSNDPSMNTSEAQKLARATFYRLTGSGLIPDPGDEELEFVAWSDHGAVGYGVSADDIRNNFIQDMYSLQGQRSTWYTGGGWAVDFTTTLWVFNDELLPKVLENL